MSIKKIKKPIHIGVLGHIDAGKTAIARCLSKIISTAGLDKHSQSKKRGITIDLGFTFFPLEKYMITLVDAPGHADLIKSVVSCANIIDLAFLVIDAKQGPQVQTGEHLIILDLMKIPYICVLINKIDLVSEKHLVGVESQIKKFMKQTRFKNSFDIFRVSAKNCSGFKELKTRVLEIINNTSITRNQNTTLKFLIDHHFKKKGYGTILTGTVLKGAAKIGDEIFILPPNIKTKIKSIQKSKESTKKMIAGDRCGVAVANINPNQIFRGCFATNNKDIFFKGQIVEAEINKIPLFQKQFKFGQALNINHGMMALNGRIFPFFEIKKSYNLIKVRFSPEYSQNKYSAYIWFNQVEYLQIGDNLLLSRLDLSPKTLRIFGTAKVRKILNPPINLYKEKIIQGMVKHTTNNNSFIVVKGLAQSKKGAETLLNYKTETPFGEIYSTFGQKGNVKLKILDENFVNKEIAKGTRVTIKKYKEFIVKKDKSY